MRRLEKFVLFCCCLIVCCIFGNGIKAYAEPELVEIDWDMAVAEGSAEPYLYSLDDKDGEYTENHIWKLEAGSEHMLYVKRPDGTIFVMPMYVSPQKTEALTEGNQAGEDWSYSRGKIAGEDKINEYLGKTTEASTEMAGTEKVTSESIEKMTWETVPESGEQHTENTTQNVTIPTPTDMEAGQGINWTIILVVLVFAVAVVVFVIIMSSRKKK